MEMIKAFDQRKEAKDVIKVLKEKIRELENGEADSEDLIIQKNASKNNEAYSVENRTVAALKRYREKGIKVKPGQKVKYVVRDDEADSLDRVRLSFEASDYDADFYITELVRATESILSPLGLDREDIRKEVNGVRPATLS